MCKLLIVEDDSDEVSVLQDWLTEAGHSIEVALDGATAQQKLLNSAYDVVILDLLLPDLNGLDICLDYRRQGGSARIIVLSGKSSTLDKEKCLDAGADDYVTKPVDLIELSARIRALMRRTLTITSRTLSSFDLVMDLDCFKVTRGGIEINLLPQEFALLEFLMRYPNRVFSPETLRVRVWRGSSTMDTVRTHIKTLRKKIDRPDLPALIKTIHGIGYALTVDNESATL